MTSLTDPDFVTRLERLYLLSRKVLAGSLQADRRSVLKGSGITFADHAEYSFGDDHRAIDWRVYARVESLMIKMFEREEDMPVHVILDVSPSMSAKLDLARELAAALGYLALQSMDELAVWTLNADLSPLLRPGHGRNRAIPMLRALDALETSGEASDLERAAKTFQRRQRRRTMVVVLSDFLFPGGFADGLQRLRFHGHDVYAIQIQSDADRSCSAQGDVELECVETGTVRRITLTPARIAAYERAVEAWNERLRTTCARNAIGLAVTDPKMRFEEIILGILRRGGLVA